MIRSIFLHPQGVPAEQGSMRPRPIRTGSTKAGTQRITGMRVTHSNPDKLLPWRGEIIRAARDYMAANDHIKWPISGAIRVTSAFRLPRPKNHYRAGRYSHLLKPTAPPRPTKKHDVDKLERAVFDALTLSGMITDDGLITQSSANKAWTPAGSHPGAHITITPIEPLELL